jgi:hypothetical protein
MGDELAPLLFVNPRLNLIADERGIDRQELREAKASFHGLVAFAARHHVSLDWLLFGDLRALRQTIRWRNGYPLSW